MATLSPEARSLSPNNDNIDVIGELLQGYHSASQLKSLIQNPFDAHDPLSTRQHLAIVLRSFTHSLSLLSSPSSSSSDIDFAQNLVVSGENEPPAPDQKSLDPSESRRRPPAPAAAKNRRGCYKRRSNSSCSVRTEQTRTVVSSTSGDNHAWRKYGQKEILNFKFPRSYLRCTRKYEQGCRALKQVQRIQENPELYQITYIGYHTCEDIIRTSQVVTESGSDRESLIFAADSSKIPKNQVTKANPIIKQEHLHPKKEETPSDDFSDSSSLDPSLWSDLKDLSEAVMVSLGSDNNADAVYSCCSAGSLDFGIVDDPVHFGSADDFHFLG